MANDESKGVSMLGNVYQNIHVEGSGRVLLGNEYSTEPQAQKILKWLSPLDAWAKHNEARAQYRQGTLDWFFEDRTFLRWLDGDTQVLWCPGPMGTGKTILMSAVLAHLHERILDQQDVAVAFVYCQHQARDVQTLTSIMGCLLSQLYARASETPNIPASVRNAYRSRPNVSPTSTQLRQWLAQEAKLQQRTIVLLDGLDEVNQHLRDELLDAVGFAVLNELQVFVTSRPLPDIKTALCDPTVLEVRAPTSSVEALISSRLKAPSSRRFMNLIQANAASSSHATNLEWEVRAKIAGKAQGMLLLASLQLDLLLNSRSMTEIRKTLRHLPPTLDKYYDITWERINGYDDNRDSDCAKLALTWVVHSTHAFTPRQLQHSIAASSIEPLDVHNGLIPEEDILSLCAGLLTSSEATLGKIVFSHLSAVEYFQARRARYFPDGHDVITRAYTRYLNLWLKGVWENEGDRNITHKSDDTQQDTFISWSRLFKFDCSGLGGGKQLVLLSCAYERLWYHARRATVAQDDVLKMINQHPVLYGIMVRNDWKRCRCPDWVDKESDFWYIVQATHHGLTNHPEYFERSALSATHISDPGVITNGSVCSATSLMHFYVALAQSSLSSGTAWRSRVHLLCASQIYQPLKGDKYMEGCVDKPHDDPSLLEVIRLTLLHGADERVLLNRHGEAFSSNWFADAEDLHNVKPLIRPSTETGLSDTETQKALISAIRGRAQDYPHDFLRDVNFVTESGAHPIWYAYISRAFWAIRLLVELGADISGLRDDPVLSLPDVAIWVPRKGHQRMLGFTAYGPDKSWFNGLDFIVSAPECIDGVWLARVEIPLNDRSERTRNRLKELSASDKRKQYMHMGNGEYETVWNREF